MPKTKTAKSKTIKKLTGQELLAKVKELATYSREEKAIACGYVTDDKRADMTKFRHALLDAEGIFADEAQESKKAGRQATYRTKVQANNILMVGSSYTKEMDLKPGTQFEVRLGRGKITLTQVEDEE